MSVEEIQVKIRCNEEAQDELSLSQKEFAYQIDETRQAYIRDRQLKEEVLDYFYGEPEQYLFEDGLEQNRRNEHHFLESSEEITGYFSKEKRRLAKENDDLYKQEIKELREEDAHGKNGNK